ncbi:MAG: DUF11 domain-containing protein [Anaerolineae bacterium]|nr:DUF11 domain-containing protein [Anaerolineae bacterium]
MNGTRTKLLGSTLFGLTLLLALLMAFDSSAAGGPAAPAPYAPAEDAIAAAAVVADDPPPEPASWDEIDLAALAAQAPPPPSRYPAPRMSASDQDLLRLLSAPLASPAPTSPRATTAYSEPHILIEKFADYYAAAGVVITQARGTFVGQSDAWAGYQAGDLDDIIPPGDQIDAIKADLVYSTELYTLPSSFINYYGFFTDVPPLDNADLRAALSAAIDRQTLVNDVFGGQALPALTFTPPGTFGHVDGYTEGVGHPYSPATAQALLAASGYTGTPPITLMFNDSPTHQAVAEAVRQMWIDTLGVTVTLESRPWGDYLDLIRNGAADERPGIFRMGWGGDFPDAHNFLSLFHSGSGFNPPRYNNPDYDDLIDQAAAEITPATRLDLYEEAERYLVMTDTAVAPLYYGVEYRVTVSDVNRTLAHGWGQHLDQWSFDGDARPLDLAWGNVTQLDPALAYGGANQHYVEQLFLGLTDFDTDGNVYGELATGWDVSGDATVYTFTLRGDAEWTNGDPVTAYDVEYGILRSLDPATGSEWAFVLYNLANAEDYNYGNISDSDLVGVEAIDDTHVVFTLTTPAAYFPAALAMPPARPQPEGAITTHGDAWTLPGNIVTNGPYQLAEWVPASIIGVYKESFDENIGEGGVAWLHVTYWNDGAAPAPGVVITDTLDGMTYLLDSSSFTHTGTGVPGDPIVWEVGELAPYSWGEFAVFVQIDAAAWEVVTNTVQIETANPYDMGDQKTYAWSAEVTLNDTYLRVDKWAWTGDPAPGYESIHEIQVCNDGSTRSTEVVLTDTLHPSFTLQTWWADPPYWTEVFSDDHELVLSRSSVGAWECGNVYLRVLLDADAWRNMEVWDEVVIASGNDIDGDNNEATWWGNVQSPYTNLSIDKSWAFGQPVPDGAIGYNIGYGNNGNVPAAGPIRITDTLPVSTTYLWAFHWGPEEPIPFTPTLFTDDYVVWEFGELENGFWDNFIVIVGIDPDVPADTLLLNTAEITELPYEWSYADNVSTYGETVNDPGPNLRVTKEHQWWGWDNSQLYYQINVTNVGTETAYGVRITDTYPADTTFNGWQWNDYWMWSNFFTTTTELVWEFEQLDPGNSTWAYFVVDVDHPGEPLWTYTNVVEVTTLPGEIDVTDNTDTDVAFSGGEVQWVDLNVYEHDLWGCAYDTPVVVTTPHEERTYWDTCWGDWFDDAFMPGDVITVAAGSGVMPVVFAVPEMSASASSITNTVWGQVAGVYGEPLHIDVYDYMTLERLTDGSGNFSALFPDIARGAQGEVRYWTSVNYADVTFHRRFQTPDLAITVDYSHDWVNGNYEPGHTVWITLTDSTAAPKATAMQTTGPIPDWGGQSGFQIDWDDWSPQGPDIEPGDWVFGLLRSQVYTTAVRVGEIDATANVTDDTVSGVVNAPWLAPDKVAVSCEIHEQNGDSIQVYNVDPDGGSFFCDFGGRYDIVPGTNVAVNYVEPDNDRVQMHPDNPAPRLRIEKWSDGTPGAGGNLSFRIQYRNEGGLTAENVLITDTLEGMTYLYDTSGFDVTTDTIPGGEQVVWDLGTVAPGDWIEFTVFVRVTETAGNDVVNTARIAADPPWDEGDEWEREARWDGTVWGSNVNLWVNKDTWTWNPVVGETFVYRLNGCNGNVTDNTSSGWVTLTDTLPLSTTLLTWWADDPGWLEVGSSDHLLVVERATVDAYRCGYVYVEVSLDVGNPGDQLCNHAAIYSSDSISGTQETQFCHTVGEPYADMGVDKWWAGGQLVPGGTFYYHGNYRNEGNVPVENVTITETVPADTTLLHVWHYDYNWNFIEMIVPTFVAPDQYVWHVGTVTNGVQGYFQFEFQIDADVEPGAELVNTIAISPGPDEWNLDNNTDVEAERVYAHGPNLRVRKDGYWHDWGDQTRQVEYSINIENVGDQMVSDVFFSDTYPEGFYMNGSVWLGGGDWWRWGDDPDSGVFTITMDALRGGENVGFNISFITDTWPLPFGMVLTNTAKVLPTDAFPENNIATVVLGTGPNLWVEKEWIAGEVQAGELVTFSLTFGNDANTGYWNLNGTAWLTDTLPDAMTFVTATQRWCNEVEWCPVMPVIDGNDLVFGLWPIQAGHWNQIYLTVEISDTVSGSDVLTNWAEIASDQPITDTEPFYDDNTDSAVVVITEYTIYLPLVMRGN